MPWRLLDPLPRRAEVGGGRSRLQQPCLSPAHLGPGLAARHPHQAERGARRLPRVGLHQSQPSRAAVGQAKEWRAIATRYEKTANSFMGVLCLAATIDWIKR